MNVRTLSVLVLAGALAAQLGCASSGAADTDADQNVAVETPQNEPSATLDDQAETSETVTVVEAEEPPAEQTAREDAQRTAKPAIEATGVVAVVDGEEISAEAFNARIARRLGTQTKIPERIAKQLTESTLEKLIETHLIERVIALGQPVVSDAAVRAKLDAFIDRFPNEATFEKFLKGNGVTREQFAADMRQAVRLEKLLMDEYDISVTDADARAFYDQHIDRFTHEAQVKASHILLKVDKKAEQEEVDQARGRAEELVKQAKMPGADFAALAKEHSEGPTAPKGGDLGYFPKDRMVPKFADVAFSLDVGEIAGPVRTLFGFHVILVTDIKPAGKESFAEVREKIIDDLVSMRQQAAMRDWMAKLKAEAEIERKPENIMININGAPKAAGQ